MSENNLLDRNTMTPLQVLGPAVASDAELLEVVGDIATAIFHPVGTCRMGVDGGAAHCPRLYNAAHHVGQHSLTCGHDSGKGGGHDPRRRPFLSFTQSSARPSDRLLALAGSTTTLPAAHLRRLDRRAGTGSR